jgi:hypothetical protein
MNFLKIAAITGALFAGATLTHGQSPVFTCQAPPAGFVPGLAAELQRQSVTVSGVMYVNCCATKEYSSELNNGILKVTLAATGPCDCVDQPCRIELFLPVGVSAVSRVTVMTDAQTILLDTLFVRAGIAGKTETLMKNAVPGDTRIFDLRGRSLGSGGKRPLLPLGVYLTQRRDRSMAAIIQP